jgi:hypothetical protein
MLFAVLWGSLFWVASLASCWNKVSERLTEEKKMSVSRTRRTLCGNINESW